ncbi:hypothetical protein PWM22_00775 [Lactobacillus gasseri]|nr:hypothetical protein [Lactobacillus gasseri]MDE1533933.1 hypothetical protein [Lactobacillus gasseri]
MEEKNKEKHNLKTIVFDEVNGIHTQSEEMVIYSNGSIYLSGFKS